MAYSYEKLWKMLDRYGMSSVDLHNKIELSTSTIAKLRLNQNVSMETISRICEYFGCELGDVVEYKSTALEFIEQLNPYIKCEGYSISSTGWPEFRYILDDHQVERYVRMDASGEIRNKLIEFEMWANLEYTPNCGILDTSRVDLIEKKKLLTISASFAVTKKFIEWFVRFQDCE